VSPNLIDEPDNLVVPPGPALALDSTVQVAGRSYEAVAQKLLDAAQPNHTPPALFPIISAEMDHRVAAPVALTDIKLRGPLPTLALSAEGLVSNL